MAMRTPHEKAGGLIPLNIAGRDASLLDRRRTREYRVIFLQKILGALSFTLSIGGESANPRPLWKRRADISDLGPPGAIVPTLRGANPYVSYPALQTSSASPGGCRNGRRYHQIPAHQRERCGVAKLHINELPNSRATDKWRTAP